MRPTPDEVITGIRRILKDVVEPAVTSDYALTALANVRAAMAQVDWNDASTTLAVESAALQGIAARAITWIDEESDRRTAFADQRRALDDVARTVPDALDGFDIRNDRAETFSRALVDFHAALANRAGMLADDADELRVAIERHFARLD